MSKIAKIDYINGMAEQMEPLLSQNQFTDESIIEIKQHYSKLVFTHFLPSNHFPLIFAFLHPTDLLQMMWVNKTFRNESCRYIKGLTSLQKILISQEIIRFTRDTMEKVTEDCKAHFNREVSDDDSFIRYMNAHVFHFHIPEIPPPQLEISTNPELDPVEQLLYPVMAAREDSLNEQKNQKLLLYASDVFIICGGSGLWGTFFMWLGNVAPLTLKIVASASGGALVLSGLIFSLSQFRSRITKGCFRKVSINFQGYNLWNEDAMRLRRAITYLRLLDNRPFTVHSGT